MSPPIALALRGTSVLRSGQRLLDSVDLSIGAGQPVVVQGPNGAGKTTLLRVLAGLMPVSEGEVEVFGDRLPLDASTQRRISAALDEPHLWPWMTAHGVIRTVADLGGRPRPDVSALLAEIGLDDARFALRRSKRVGRFSQGMRKRLQVACALAMESDILLVDEPTASLDPQGAELVWQALERRVARGSVVVVATHDDEAADRLSARLVRMAAGRVVEDSANIAATPLS